MRVALAAMLDNLLKNSVEALGVAGGHVSFAWVVDDVGQVLLEVSDDGPGVPEPVLKALQDRQSGRELEKVEVETVSVCTA